ncbi:uncharacterized protein HD556DRAFT_1520162 [Suillus plorans]|uniref:CHAT domain-containing protein n=1 Tax=Suillus plorans TaxID=116603 RepID=A0A9P7DG95_9AGAM|nr:uncharacterized protein HD556DRAFT_1520162 [Suillus plorans]KAG1791595.1 hypothetical protein HD556DRAFT_1520162 [Suillus plorans]
MNVLALETDAGHRLLAQYCRIQSSGNLEQSIEHFERALDLCPMDHPYHPAALFNLATAKFVSCQADGRYLDLDIPISLFQRALDLCATDHPDRGVSQLHLAIALLSRFAKRGFEADADAAEELLSEVLKACQANSHIYRAALITMEIRTLHSAGRIKGNDLEQEQPTTSMFPLSPNQLADQTKWCLQRDEPGALDEVISLHYDALRYYNTGHACRGQLLDDLAGMLETRFEPLGLHPSLNNLASKDEDLDQAITLDREVLALRPVGHADRSASLSDLAALLSYCFDHRGNDEDLDEAITFHREALDRSASLSDLADRGNYEDLDEAITLQREALALRLVGHADWFLSLNNLANRLSSRFEHQGNDEDLEQAIALQREALALRPVGHTDRSASLSDLSVELSSRFDHRGNDKDLDEAITLQTEALTLCPVGHIDRSMSLYYLAHQLSSRFEHQGNDEDLNQAITLLRDALVLRPVGHTERSKSLDDLANHLSSRFEHRGNNEDLDQAIALNREALTLLSVDHTDRSMSLNNLASGLFSRFVHRGRDEDLDEAIALNREALALRPTGHTDRSISLNNLAVELSSRFEHRGNDKDLDQAIGLLREALALRPVGHTGRSMSLDELANQVSSRFEHRGSNEDLDEAIALHREALALRPISHTDRSMSLNNLANDLSSRFAHRGKDEDLDEAITLDREALALVPVGHTDRSKSLSNLAIQLSFRFEHRNKDEDLDEAITLNREALDLRPIGHIGRSKSLNNLATQLFTRFEHQSNREDLEESRENLRFENTDSLNVAMHHLKAAANVVSAGLLPRLRASLHWARHASEYSHGTQLEAYTMSMQLLDAYMSVTASVLSRHKAMKEFPRTLAVDAASCALRSGDVPRAVELLEQGRTIIWTQMARLRTPLDSLQTHGDHAVILMKRFRDLSSLLDKTPADHSEDTPRVDVEADEIRYRRLVEDWNGTVEEIRKIEGFSRFLLPPLFSDLQDAGRDGPIIMLIASESSCDAIIVPHEQPPTSIQLPTNFQKLAELEIAFREAVPKDAGPKGNQRALMVALRKLWDVVVRPVVENLGAIARRGSRIWWCPTSVFNFLPLHAAGEYRKDGESLSRHYISSYTPSLTALIKARANHDKSLSVPFVAIGQNHPAGVLFTLDAVEPELELVRTLLPPPPTPLSLLDIAQMDLSRHQFAFLSACETAVGVPATPDEVIHLAAGLQFAGVKSVVGTLWKVDDPTVQRLVKAFYTNLCGDGTMNSKRAARALHRAVQLLASDRDIPLAQRIVFVHIGI